MSLGARILSRGRFGSWKYDIGNQDHSLMQGVEWVAQLRQPASQATAGCVTDPHVLDQFRRRDGARNICGAGRWIMTERRRIARFDEDVDFRFV